ncbi:esterase-like activity of phytase family protein [uncultured Roseobacter sp.]|uniref:esterase-like activity of phytase family protein n=1 Tax=uncultured Roseobacter sp. TaxID=114847 RepID=UPI00262100BD|nr:esterase-like activity of phytase family protein [uncultured Roseobacter sp.]
MRRSLAVALITIAAIAPVFVFHPPPGPPKVAPEEQTAQHLSTFQWRHDAEWFGGFSGFELSEDGTDFYAVTDRGHLTRGQLLRANDQISDITLEADRALPDRHGVVREFPHSDAEGLALDAEGRLFVSFEFAHRILRYDSWDSVAKWPSYTRAWRALGGNKGLELVAVHPEAGLISIPEGVARHAWEALVYQRRPGEEWDQPFTLPVDDGFLPVGGDFGPDGKFYLLERAFVWAGFRSRVRRMTLTADGFEQIETVLETPHRRHGNLEGLAVWADGTGDIRLTMISDDNFLPILRTEIVEYILKE